MEEDNIPKVSEHKVNDRKIKFQIYLTIFLIIALTIGFTMTVLEFRTMSRDGIACKSQPFIYGAKVMTDRIEDGHMFCSCTVSGKDYYKKYSFDEINENPLPKGLDNSFNLSNLKIGLS